MRTPALVQYHAPAPQAVPAGVRVDPLEMEMIKPYCLYVVAFAAGIYANMRALEGESRRPTLPPVALRPTRLRRFKRGDHHRFQGPGSPPPRAALPVSDA